MKLLQVVPTYWPAVRYGGTIVSTRGLARALAARGHEVCVLTTSVDGPTDRRELEGAPRDVDGLAVRYFPCGFPRRLYRAPALGRWLAANASHFDVIHAHAAFLWPSWRARRAALAAGKPFVYSPRGMLAAPLIRLHNALVKEAWIALVERTNLASAAAIHVTSAGEAAALERLVPRLGARVIVIPNGVERAAPDARIPREPDRILYLGRLSPEKRVDALLEALARVPGARLTIAGSDGGSGHRAALEALVARRGLRPRVEFLGFADDDAKRALLSRAAIVALPSVFESFGNVVLEAMAMGCAVVVAPGVGAAEWVLAADAGRIVECDPPVLARALEELVSDPHLAASQGARGKAFVEDHLDWGRVAEQMERLYTQVVVR